MNRYRPGTGIITSVGIVSFVLLGVSAPTFATSVTDEINVTIPASCSLTSVVGSAHTSTIETGVYQDDIGETTFKVFCNDSEGFAVYAVGYTDDTFGNNTLKPANLASSYAIATGTATSGDTSNWAMKLTAVTGTYAPTIHSTEENSNTYSFTSYHTIPSEYTKVASYSSNTDAATGSSFKSTYAAFISQTQIADSFTGKVKYTIVHPSSEPAPIGSISQLTYMQDFNNLTAEEKASVFSSMAYNTVYSLVDSRDDKAYQIARLKDDNIWMAQDLDLGRTAITKNLTSANTNFSNANRTITASSFNNWVKSSGTTSYYSAELIPLSTSNTSNNLDTDSTSNTPYGTLYNYCAVSVGTMCSSSEKYNATSDICPAGWRLPTGGSSGEFKSLYQLEDYNTLAKMRATIVDGGAAFALAGSFTSSTPTDQGSTGAYWSSTINNNTNMHYLYLDTSSFNPATYGNRRYGGSVRCVAKRPVYSITVSYGADISSIKVDGKIVQNGGAIELERNTYQIAATPSLGYGFSSWSKTSGQMKNDNAQVTTYSLNEDTTISATASYVATEIQNIASSNCTTIASYARDNRDNRVYTIQRLVDGKCWIIENLDLGRTALTTDLTSSNTNLTNTVTASTFNGWKKTYGSNTYTAGVFIPVDGEDSISGTPYGTLYNYCAASAGTICVESGANNDNATSDLCPAGWRLPTGGSSGEFQSLYNKTAWNKYTNMRASISDGGEAFAFAGFFYNSAPTDQGSTGDFLSSTRYDGSSIYTLNLYTSTVSFAATARSGGHSIRCVSDI